MEIKLTEEQKKVVYTSIRNILVSAAAGSGKTAVLVQRILEMGSREKDPVDVDRLLVVTFTNNAAAQMKERIQRAMEKAYEAHPEHTALLRQMNLLQHASIMTIDSFCQSVVKRYFHLLDIDPAFRILDETESKLMWDETISEVLNQAHEEGSEAFLNLVDAYGGNRGDRKLEEYLTNLNRFADSAPWPERWLAEAVKLADVKDETELEQVSYVKEAVALTKLRTQELEKTLEYALTVAQSAGGPAAYVDALEKDQKIVETIMNCNTMREQMNALSNVNHVSLKRISKKDQVLETKQNLVKEMREYVKKTLAKMKESYLSGDLEAELTAMKEVMPHIQMLAELTKRARNAYQARMKEENAYGFSDIEHFALQLLVKEKEDGTYEGTDVAKQYRRQYDEIMIDEYQDSNLVQDLILNSISGEADGKPNVFCVGDVKQSIYKFRLARPELFLDKYNRYQSGEDDLNMRIDLSRNFRSRESILAAVNQIFEKIMQEKLGKIEYDERAALHPGAEYSEPWEERDKQTEYILLEEATAEQEAAIIAERIQEMTKPGSALRIRDGETIREASYGDIVVLVRSMKGIAFPLIETLLEKGIPAYAASMTGYFESMEVKTVLSFLQILDNPKQDIPFASVMQSYIGGFSQEDLAACRILGEELGGKRNVWYAYDVLRYLAGLTVCREKYQELRNRAEQFLKLYDALREKLPYLQVSELLEEIYRVTGFATYVGGLPGGSVRFRNLQALVVKAGNFQKGKQIGIGDFVQFINRMIRYEIKVSDDVPAELENAVRVMTIHASKGLEFPIVILPDMMRKFNDQEMKKIMVLHEESGVGIERIKRDEITGIRMRKKTLSKQLIIRQLKQELLGEELRILYVAMTRAKEKMLFVGITDDRSKLISGLQTKLAGNEKLTYEVLASAENYQSLLLAALFQNLTAADMEEMNEKAGEKVEKTIGRFRLLLLPAAKVDSELQSEEKEQTVLENMLQEQAESEWQSAADTLRQYYAYRYPYQNEQKIPVKVSVSEVKMHAMEETAVQLVKPEISLEHEDKTEPIPAFAKTEEKQKVKGSDRGTLYHRILELHDYCLDPENTDAAAEIAKAIVNKQIGPEAEELLDTKKLMQFYRSSVGLRMHQAALAGTLCKEQQFVMSMPASQVDAAYESEEPVLIQGIVDVFFEEDGRYVLLDYKTDRVPEEDGCEILIKRYAKQLELYADAIEKATGKKVAERIIYSFALQKVIIL